MPRHERFRRQALAAVLAAGLAALALPERAAADPAITRARPGAGEALPLAGRTLVRDDIWHYRFDLRVGEGKHDVVRLHRVVRESRPFRPIRTLDAIVLLPGSANFFESIFMPPLISAVPSSDLSFAVFLAQADFDVWGIDYGWALVPADTSTFRFMRGWGVEKDTRHTQAALSAIRSMRERTKQGSGGVSLLGYSYGGIVAYSVAGRETRLPRSRRHVKGLVVADVPMRFEDAGVRGFYCGVASSDRSRIAAGEYQDASGSFANAMGEMAVADPEGESSLVPGFTNVQLALAFGAQTSMFDGNPFSWHFVGGDIDPATGLARDLTYTERGLWLDLLRSLPPYQPLQQALDLDTMFCGQEDVTFDDHLGDIRLPLLYAGAPGGYGEYGEYTTTLTASDDVQRFTVAPGGPAPERALAFGHGDLFLGRDARELAWEPILAWLAERR